VKKLQKTYDFTLLLKNVDQDTPHLEDSLYEVGCDDALINFRNGAVYLDFARAATSFEDAIMTAIRDVESASIGAAVASVAPEDLVTETEVARRLDIKRQAVSLWIKAQRRKTHPFPKPFMNLSNKSPLWKWSEITKWLYHNHLIDEKEIVDNALFVENVNVVLGERDVSIRKYRERLLKKLENFTHPH